MDHASLDLGLRVHRPDCLFEACKPVYIEEKYILYHVFFRLLSIPGQNLIGYICPCRAA